jgi:hypothetical protein
MRFAARSYPRWLEDAGIVIGAALATLHAEWRIISDPLVFQTDAQIHEFWMYRFQNPDLFQDPVTKALLASGYEPPGFQALYWAASHLLNPVFFGELLPLVLQPLAVWLVFRIVRDHTDWRPAAWIGAALFLVPWNILRFSGGHPRAFAQPIVLLTVLLLLRKRGAAAAVIPTLGWLFYPPAGLVALVVVLLGAFEPGERFLVARGRALWAGGSFILFAIAALATRVFWTSADLITREEAHRLPELGPGGQFHYFAATTLGYLKQNYSGFSLRSTGSIVAVSAVLLLLVRPRNALLLRWPVWSMPIAGLLLFAAAHALAFRLYLPQRYTYPLLPFFCIAVAVALQPTLQAFAARDRRLLLSAALLPVAFAFLALTVFPLGPQLPLSSFGSFLGDARWYLAVGLGVALLLAAIRWGPVGQRSALTAATLVAGSLLVAEMTFAGGLISPGATECQHRVLYKQLERLPADAILAGNPSDLSCIPIAARRPVVISRKLYQPWEREYLSVIRPRMFATVAAMYGPSPSDVVALRTRYGADYLLLPRQMYEGGWNRMAPFTAAVERLRERVAVPAVRRLPTSCRTWRGSRFELFDLACVANEYRS